MYRLNREDVPGLLKWEKEQLNRVCHVVKEMRLLFEMLDLSCVVALERKVNGEPFELQETDRPPDGFAEVIHVAPTQEGYLMEREEGEFPMVTWEIARLQKGFWRKGKFRLYEKTPEEIWDLLHKTLGCILADPSAYRVNWPETKAFLQGAASVCYPFEGETEGLAIERNAAGKFF